MYRPNANPSGNTCDVTCNPVTLIVNNALLKTPFVHYLGSGFKVKGRSMTPKDSIILTRSPVGILLVFSSKTLMGVPQDPAGAMSFGEPSQVGPQVAPDSPCESDEELIQRLKHFYKTHQKTIVVMVSSVFGEEEHNFMTSRLMLKLLPRSPLFLLAHGEAQAASHVQIIAKTPRVEARQIVHSRISSEVHVALSQDIHRYLAHIWGISEHEMSVVMDTLRDLPTVAAVASAAEIHQKAPLDRQTAEAIFNFLNKDTIVI